MLMSSIWQLTNFSAPASFIFADTLIFHLAKRLRTSIELTPLRQ
jgi:hypothetical protein